VKKILIIGDSTIQLIRPHRIYNSDFTFSELLSKEYDTIIKSIPGLTSNQLLKLIWNEYFANDFEYVIISIGINDLTPRSYPRWLYEINNRIIVLANFYEKMFSAIYSLITNKKIQTFFSKYNVSKPWISRKRFKLNLEMINQIVKKESNSEIIYITPPILNERISKILPSINYFHSSYKKILKNLKSNRVWIIDTDEIFKSSPKNFVEEGIHFSNKGHLKIYKELKKIIQ